MARVEIGKHMAVDTRVCGGRLVFSGSRIMVADAVELSGMGYSPEDIAHQYYDIITPEAVREALSFIRRGTIREVRKRVGRLSTKSTLDTARGRRARNEKRPAMR